MTFTKLVKKEWHKLICGVCLHGYKPYFCRGKIPVTLQQQNDLDKIGCCHAFVMGTTETLSDKD